jgi:LuxR family maltose regulon positive regulatory protein
MKTEPLDIKNQKNEDNFIQSESGETQVILSTPQVSDNSIPLISTKIHPPRLREELLLRTRLVNQLHVHLERKLIILSAPAGYGKTSLLIEFASETEFPVCWFTLDNFDRDLRTFLEYFIAAIAIRFPDFGDKSHQVLKQLNDPIANMYAVVTALVQEIQATIPEYFIIILDDFQCVDGADSIAEFLDLFITYVDENCHVILSSRTLPVLPNLVLLISRRQAIGLSIDELRFTPSEIQALVLQNYHFTFNPQEADSLIHRTGGWITGILLSADANWKMGQVELPKHGRINQELYDFLTSHLLSHETAQMQEFLLISSVLDEVSPWLCSQILQIDQCSQLIDQVRQRNLFVAEYEGPGGILRYHDLFHEYLRSRFQKESPQIYHQLSLRVAEYYATQKEWDRVIERYLILGEFSRSAELLNQLAPDFYSTGRWDTLAGWIDSLPEGIGQQYPNLLIQRGKIYGERGQHTQAIKLFQQAEEKLNSPIDLARIHVLRASILRFQDHYTEAIALCQQALIFNIGETTDVKLTRAIAHKNIGLCWLSLGKIDEGRSDLRKAMRLYEELGILHDIGMIHHDMGLAKELTGDLRGAINHYQTALNYWQKLGNPSPWANELNSLGVIYYLQGDYQKAIQSLNKALEKIQLVGDIRIQAFILGSMADVYRDIGLYSQASQFFIDALELAHRANTGMMITYALDGLGNLARLQRNFSEARFRFQDAWEYAQDHATAYELSLCHLSQGILANEMADLELARFHLLEAIEYSYSAGLRQNLSRSYLQLAQTDFLAGKYLDAWDNLRQSLSIAQSLGYDHFLVIDGSRLTSLLSSASQQNICREQVIGLLTRIKNIENKTNIEIVDSQKIEQRDKLIIRAFGHPEILSNNAVTFSYYFYRIHRE